MLDAVSCEPMDHLFKKILCPIDYDNDSVAASKVAPALARQNGALFHSVHVVRVAASDLGHPAAAYDRLRRLEQNSFEETLRSSVPDNFPATPLLKSGTPLRGSLRPLRSLALISSSWRFTGGLESPAGYRQRCRRRDSRVWSPSAPFRGSVLWGFSCAKDQ